MLKLIVLSFCLSLWSKEYYIEPDHSQIFFEVQFLNFSQVRGFFSDLKGKVKFSNNELKELKVFIKSESVNSGNKMRDSHLKNKDFFQVKKYPYIIFEGKQFFESEIQGELIIKGVKKIVKIKYDLSKQIDTWNKEVILVNFSTHLKKSEFNLKWNKALLDNNFLIKDRVKISGNLELRPIGTQVPSSMYMIPISNYSKIKGSVSATKKIKQKPRKAKEEYKVVSPEEKKDLSTISKLAFLIVAFFGLGAATFLCLFGKKWYLEKKGEEYTSFQGLIADLVFYPVFFLYIAALWVVGKDFFK